MVDILTPTDGSSSGRQLGRKVKYGAIRSLRVAGSPEAIGASHGATFSDDIVAYSAERVSIVTAGDWSGAAVSTDQVLSIAESMLPAHDSYAEDLSHEMTAMAAAAGISAAEAVVVGGFTDFVDTVRGLFGDAPYEDNCTAMIVPAPRAQNRQGMLGQTWDMHDTATEHVILLDLEPEAGPRALVFTTVGCLGQIGMNEAGIAIGINNLTAAAGTTGVTWPFVVRKALQQSDLDAAVKSVLDADLAGAHNFLVVDAAGRGVNIEAMPQHKHVTEVAEVTLVHTNHTLEESTTVFEAQRPSGLMESSHRRLSRARRLVDGKTLGPDDLMAITRDSEAVCQVSHEPFHVESCGAAVMRPATGEFWAVWGRPDLNEYERFEL